MVNTHSAQLTTTADRVIELVHPQTACGLPLTDEDATSCWFAASRLLSSGSSGPLSRGGVRARWVERGGPGDQKAQRVVVHGEVADEWVVEGLDTDCGTT